MLMCFFPIHGKYGNMFQTTNQMMFIHAFVSDSQCFAGRLAEALDVAVAPSRRHPSRNCTRRLGLERSQRLTEVVAH